MPEGLTSAAAPTAHLDRVERAAGIALGGPTDHPRPAPARFATGRAALEAVIAKELEASPCVVSFSGGRDSSAILAVATHVARREGLPPPVPVTFRFPDVPLTEEGEWQERVITHLGLHQWERIDLTDELDLLGDVSRQSLLAHGITWPPNSYLHLPVFEVAKGGVVLTGLDGDGLFADWRWGHAQAVLHRRVAATWRDPVRVGFAVAPARVRRLAMGRRALFVPGWLRPAARRDYVARTLARLASEPRRWDRRTVWHERSRALAVARTSLQTLATPFGVTLSHPLLHPDVIAAMAREGGAAGYGDRTAAMRHLFGDLLPAATVERQSKAVFGGAVWQEGARAFVESWDGRGVDPDNVDAELLRRAWRAEHPVFHSWTPLQEAFLAAQGGGPGPSGPPREEDQAK